VRAERLERLYRRLLPRLFPDLSPRDAAAMTAALRDLCRDARRRGGAPAELRAALHCFSGALGCALAERRERAGARRRRPAEVLVHRLEELAHDARQGLRQLWRNPGLSLAVVATLALALAANAAVFGVLNAVLLERLPYRDPDRVVFVAHHYARMQASGSVPGLLDYRREARAFEGIAASAPGSANLTGGGDPERLDGLVVTANFFEVLGVDAARGRTFLPGEDQPGRADVVVISHGLWQRRFGGDPGLLGPALQIDGAPRVLVGIMPEGFRRGRGWGRENLADVWVPLELTEARRDESRRGDEFLDVYARLTPGVSLEQAQADIDRVAAAIRARLPDRYTEVAGWHHRLLPLKEEIAAPLRPLLLALLGAVLALLLIAATNIAGLLLARAAARRRETSIRAALGAGRARLVRQLLTESAVLACVAVVAGLGVARIAVGVLEGLDRVTLPRAQPIELDARVLGFTLAVALLALLVGGLIPALQGATRDLMAGLRSRAAGGGTPLRTRRILVVAQTGVALALLVATGLMLRSLGRLGEVEMGFRPQDRLVFRVALPASRYGDAAARVAFAEALLERVRALPGARRAAAVHGLPLSGELNSGSFEIEGRVQRPDQPEPHAQSWSATPGYFETLGIPLREGRLFETRDAAGAPPVAIVSRTLAERYWPDESAVGRRIDFEGSDGDRRWREIVGVVGDVRSRGPDAEPRPQLYTPWAQRPFRSASFVLHAAGEPLGLIAGVRAALRGVDPEQPLYGVTTLATLAREAVGGRRAVAMALSGFAMAALLLAALGLYALLAYTVRERSGEIGVRMALGAAPGDLVRQFVREGLALALPGLALGAALAYPASRLLEGLVFGVDLGDAPTWLGVALTLVVAALAASAIPAWRAARVDPLVALRAD
jgi:predicted permease